MSIYLYFNKVEVKGKRRIQVLAKEQAFKAFANQKTERVPVCLFLGGSWPLTYAGYTLEKLIGDPYTAAKAFFQANEELEADIVTVGAGATALTIRALGGEVRFDSKGAPSIIGELIKTEQDLERLDLTAALESEDLQWLKQQPRNIFDWLVNIA